MRDINFFEPYVGKKEDKELKKRMFYGTLCIFIFVLAAIPLINHIRIRKITKEVMAIKASLESDEAYERLRIVEEREKSLEQISLLVESLQRIDAYMEEIDRVDDELLSEIINFVPDDLFFESINMTPNQVQIQGKALTKDKIAQFEHDIANTAHFKNVFIPNIVLHGDMYQFSMIFEIKDVNDVETE